LKDFLPLEYGGGRAGVNERQVTAPINCKTAMGVFKINSIFVLVDVLKKSQNFLTSIKPSSSRDTFIFDMISPETGCEQ
jgi:hypothetical protein